MEDSRGRNSSASSSFAFIIASRVAERRHAAHPHALLFRGGDLVANALTGDLPLELGEGQQNIEVSRPIEVVVLNC
jgi:hypothetical protein